MDILEPDASAPFNTAFSGWLDLPVELWEMIFSHLPSWYLSIVSLSCKQWRETISGLSQETVWWDICEKVALAGWLSVLKWLKKKTIIGPGVICTAARGGHLHVLKWLKAQNFWLGGPIVCVEAARSGRLEVLQWLRSQYPSCPWDKYTCMWMAGGGHLPMLQWARAQDPPCPWDERTCGAAIEEGHMEVLKWLINNGCPCDIYSCITSAKKHQRDDVIEFLQSIRK